MTRLSETLKRIQQEDISELGDSVKQCFRTIDLLRQASVGRSNILRLVDTLDGQVTAAFKECQDTMRKLAGEIEKGYPK